MKVLVINGPNMQNLGNRGSVYNATYEELVSKIKSEAEDLNLDVECFVSDIEGEIVREIYTCKYEAIIINAAAYSHYSIAIRDALESFKGKKIEVHMTNIHAREQFRHNSVISGVVDGVICGFGAYSYILALRAVSTMQNLL